MTYSPHWRKAIVFSVIFHIVFLSSVGLLASRFFEAVESEPYMELELLTDTSSGHLLPLENASQAAHSANTQAMDSAVAIPHTSKTVAVADDLALEESFSQSTNNNGSATNSSAVTTNEDSGNGENGKGTGSEGNSGNRRSIVPPRILSKIDPSYPEGARKAGLTGTTVVRIQILVNGLPGDVTIHTTSGNDMLDDAAVAAVQKWRFIPAKNQDSGASVICYTTMPIAFRLK
ncbi:MAG: TonB family protein [Pelosinus sp.]|jgi:protein TonB|nr:TonB family protein [Pelosinus sp.]